MSKQYNRTYELLITNRETGETRVIRGLRLNFEITKSVISFPNLCRFTLYNANDDTLSLLQNKLTDVVINAGYFGNVRLLFKGQIRNVFQSKEGPDKMLTVYSGDGELDWQNSIFNKTFTANVSISEAIEEVMESFKNLSVGFIGGLPEDAKKMRGQTLSGSSKDILDDFAEEYGFNWSIQNGEIVVVPIEGAIDTDEAVVVNAATGMIGSPIVTEVGANVKTLLNPSLLPNRLFRIESVNADIAIGNLYFRGVKRTTATGVYKIQEVTFKGDSREGEWTSFVKGRFLSSA